MTEDELTLIFGREGGNLYEATRERVDGPFGIPRVLTEFDWSEVVGSLSKDGLTLFFSGLPHAGEYALFMAHRSSRLDAQGNPMPFAGERKVPGCPNQLWHVNYSPMVSPTWPARGSELYWSPFDPPVPGDFSADIWVTTWHPDCNGNDVDDLEEIERGDVADENGNGVPDECERVPFKRADVNTDNALNIGDAIFTLDYLFASSPAPTCLDAADANDDGAINIAYAIVVLSYLFNGVPTSLPAPFGVCGDDPMGDALGCAYYPHCER